MKRTTTTRSNGCGYDRGEGLDWRVVQGLPTGLTADRPQWGAGAHWQQGQRAIGITVKQEIKTYVTSDMRVAAFLLTIGFEYAGSYWEGHRCYWRIIDPNDEAGSWARHFDASTTPAVDARTLLDHYLSLSGALKKDKRFQEPRRS